MDINLIKNKLAQLQGQTKRKNLLWKPKPGSSIIRILPYKHRPENPFLELYFYYDVTKKTTLSPITNNDPDPIYEFSQQLRNEGTTESYKLAKTLEPKMRTYVPILVRGEESEGVKLWGFGKTVYEELLTTMSDDDYGDITNPKTGRDITVEYKKAEAGGYPKTTIRVKPNPTVVTSDKEVLGLIKEMPTVEEIWQAPTYESLEASLMSFMNNEKEAEAETAAPTDSKSDPAGAVDDLFAEKQEAVSETPTTTETISDDFDDIFND